MENQQASENMKKFFENLLDLKYDILNMIDLVEYREETTTVLQNIYNKLNDIIKEKE